MGKGLPRLGQGRAVMTFHRTHLGGGVSFAFCFLLWLSSFKREGGRFRRQDVRGVLSSSWLVIGCRHSNPLIKSGNPAYSWNRGVFPLVIERKQDVPLSSVSFFRLIPRSSFERGKEEEGREERGETGGSNSCYQPFCGETMEGPGKPSGCR